MRKAEDESRARGWRVHIVRAGESQVYGAAVWSRVCGGQVSREQYQAARGHSSHPGVAHGAYGPHCFRL